MKNYKHKKKAFIFVFASFFTLVGTYNAVVINSQSLLSSSDVKFTKRLDELYGVSTPGRLVAANHKEAKWIKLENGQKQVQQQQLITQSVSYSNSASDSTEIDAAPAAVQEDLSLSLVEVINPNKWKNGLTANDFSGALTTNNGVIESLLVSLPNNEGVSISFAEMSGNVFEYDINGEIYSGMIFQNDQYSYMITLTNGPLEGTRLRFNQILEPLPDADVNQQESAEVTSPGNFGEDQNQPEIVPEVTDLNNEQPVDNSKDNNAYNFEQPAT